MNIDLKKLAPKHVFSIGPKPLNTRPSLWQKFKDGIDWDYLDPRRIAVTAVLGTAVGYGVYYFGDGVGRPEIDTTAAILGTRYTPPYTSTEYYTDSNGHQHSRFVYHPPEYHAKIAIPQSHDPKVISLSHAEYDVLTDAARHPEQHYNAVYREGRWSHSTTWIDLKFPLSRASIEQRRASLALPDPSAPPKPGAW